LPRALETVQRTNPELLLRGAFWATKQFPPFYQGVASLKNRLRQKMPRNDNFSSSRTDSLARGSMSAP